MSENDGLIRAELQLCQDKPKWHGFGFWRMSVVLFFKDGKKIKFHTSNGWRRNPSFEGVQVIKEYHVG